MNASVPDQSNTQQGNRYDQSKNARILFRILISSASSAVMANEDGTHDKAKKKDKGGMQDGMKDDKGAMKDKGGMQDGMKAASRPAGLSCAWALAHNGKNVPVKNCAISSVDRASEEEYCFLGEKPKSEFIKNSAANQQSAKRAYGLLTDQALAEAGAMMKSDMQAKAAMGKQ